MIPGFIFQIEIKRGVIKIKIKRRETRRKLEK